jgi:hypothetical protein
LFKPLGMMTFALLTLTAASATAMGSAPQPPSVTELQTKIQTELTRMDLLAQQAAAKLALTDLRGPEAKKVLLDLHDKVGSAIVASSISLDGILLAVEPSARYSSGIGQSVTDQYLYQTLKSTNKAAMSPAFKAVEGFYAAAIGYPIVSQPDGQVAGFLSLLFQPDALIRKAVADLGSAATFEAFAIQLDGKIVYDKDILQVGRQTFSDAGYAEFPSLIAFARQLTAEAAGAGAYQYTDRRTGKVVTKAASWATVGLHGTVWRLVISVPQ